MNQKKVMTIILISLTIAALGAAYAWNTTKPNQAHSPTVQEIPSLLVEKLLIRHLLGARDAELEATLSPDEKPESDPYHFHCEGDIFTWKHVGILPNGDHIVYAYYWPDGAMGKFSGLFVVKYDQDKNTLYFVAEIAWGERHSSGVAETGWKLEGNTLTYSQHMSCHGFFDYMLDKYPNLWEYAQGKSRAGLCYGEFGYFGDGDFQVTINPDGTLQDRRLLAFNVAIAGLAQPEETPAVDSLPMLDALLYVFLKFNAKNGYSESATIQEKYLEPLVKEALSYTKKEGDICQKDSDDALAGYQPTYPLTA